MNKLILRILFFSIGFLFSIQLNATHLLGADITYTCLNADSNKYEIILSVYRDCTPGVADFVPFSRIRVHPIGSSNHLDFNGPLDEVIVVDLIPEDTCAIIPSDLCIEKGVYLFEIFLPDSTDGFELNYQRCCMGANTNNIVDPQVVGMNVTAIIPPKSFSPCYDSPVFNEEPLLAICLDDLTEADFGVNAASGSPGDISYKFYTPFKGASPFDPEASLNKPYTEIDWLPGYSENNPINSNIPITLDELTGEFKAEINEIGYFLVAHEVLIKDSLNQTVARIDRVFRYTVVDCSAGDHQVPIVSALNNNVQICLDDDFTFERGNPNTTDSLLWIIDGDTLGKNIQFTHSFSQTGNFVVELHGIADSNDCYNSGVDFLDVEVFDIRPEFSGKNYLCVGEENQFLDTTFIPLNFNYSITNWSWDFGDGQTSILKNPIHKYSNTGVYDVHLTITLSNGCIKTLKKTNYVEVYDGELSISSLLENCINSPTQFDATLNLPANVSNPIVSYFWDFGDGDTSNLAQPIHAFESLGTFTVSLVVEVESGCKYEVENFEHILIYDNYIDIDFELTYDTIEFPFNKPIEAITTSNNYDEIRWYLNKEFHSSGKNLLYSLPSEFDEENVEVIADVVEGSCTFKVVKNITILYKDNILIPNAFTPNGDGVNERFIPIGRTVDHATFYELKIYNRFGEEYFKSNDQDEGWFGTDKNGILLEQDLYIYTLKIHTNNSGSYDFQGTVMLIK